MEGSRSATAGDLDRIADLARAMRAELAAMKGGALWAVREARPEPLEEDYGRLLDRTDARLIVGTIDDTVVGFGAVELEVLRSGASLGVITDLFVEAEARAVGVGEHLAGDLVQFCTARDCVGIDALALPGHRAAKNFFEESGFTARVIVMHRRLPGPADAP
ncbi:MAG TPA: GNAT family N-acetyltransferase [Acidimicrobiia bacterium]